MNNNYKLYRGESIDIKFHPKRCIHAARCVKGLSNVFDVDKRPWINADGATADEVASVIERCPSGALEYVRKDGGDEEQPQNETTIDVQPGNVIYVRGNLNIKSHDGKTVQYNRMSLCGCGHSRNKPFCDLSDECRK